MAHNGRKLADDAVIAMLASGKSITDTARECGVGARTIHRRMQDDDFVMKLAEARATMFRQTVGALASSMHAAASVLRDLLAHEDPNVRYRAAAKLLDAGTRAVELGEVEARITALESRMREQS